MDKQSKVSLRGAIAGLGRVNSIDKASVDKLQDVIKLLIAKMDKPVPVPVVPVVSVPAPVVK